MSDSPLPLAATQLGDITAGRIPVGVSHTIDIGAMPPSFVGERSLALRAQGNEGPWWQICLMVRTRDQKLVGLCGFNRELESGS